jgi:dihydrofolate reductase
MGAWTSSAGDAMIRCIAAIDSSRGVATATGIPWHLPGDAAYFRDQTRHGLIVMGGATYAEFAAPLHERTNFVLTNRPDPLRKGFQPITSLDEVSSDHPDEDIWVIGGAGVFATTIASASELYLTQVLADFHCTKFFPPYDDRFVRFEQSDPHQEDGVDYRFERWRLPAP